MDQHQWDDHSSTKWQLHQEMLLSPGLFNDMSVLFEGLYTERTMDLGGDGFPKSGDSDEIAQRRRSSSPSSPQSKTDSATTDGDAKYCDRSHHSVHMSGSACINYEDRDPSREDYYCEMHRKRKRTAEVHNNAEKRRRKIFNDKLEELQQLIIPEHLKGKIMNKECVLGNAITYIQNLQEQVRSVPCSICRSGFLHHPSAALSYCLHIPQPVSATEIHRTHPSGVLVSPASSLLPVHMLPFTAMFRTIPLPELSPSSCMATSMIPDRDNRPSPPTKEPSKHETSINEADNAN